MALLATFIGIGKYSDPAIRDLVGATRDAKAFHALFVDSIPGCTPQLLVDSDAKCDSVRAALKNTLGAATSEDTVVVYYSGHGSHDHRLTASDTRLDSLDATTVPMSELAELFKQTAARAVLCVLDCCFSGGAPAKVLEESPVPRDPQPPLEALSVEGRVILAASAADQVAFESPAARHGYCQLVGERRSQTGATSSFNLPRGSGRASPLATPRTLCLASTDSVPPSAHADRVGRGC